MTDRLVVPVHYDFASTLCCVAHRVMERLAPDLDALGIELAWSPLDLARLLGWKRGAPIPEARRANAARVALELGVAVHVPTHWPDSRPLLGAALVAEEHGCGAAFRERTWRALHDGDAPLVVPGAAALLEACGVAADPAALAAAAERVAAATEAARAAEVTGVPTFVLGGWPFGGIQSEETMRLVLARWASKQRAGARRAEPDPEPPA